MKATELIKQIEKGIEKHGEDLEVFYEWQGMNYEEIYSIEATVIDYVAVDVLNDYPEELRAELHGEENGIIYGIIICPLELVDTCG